LKKVCLFNFRFKFLSSINFWIAMLKLSSSTFVPGAIFHSTSVNRIQPQFRQPQFRQPQFQHPQHHQQQHHQPQFQQPQHHQPQHHNQQFPLYFRHPLPSSEFSIQQLNSIAHIASFSELMQSIDAPSYATTEFTLPIRAFQVVSGMGIYMNDKYSKLILPGDGYNLTRAPENWHLKNSVPYVQHPSPLHISVTGVSLSHDFAERNPYVTVTVVQPPRPNMGSLLRTHVAIVEFGVSHDAPEGTVLPQELINRERAHITLSGFLRIR
jgi:hypothetical protein